MALGNIHLTPQLVQAVRDAVDIVDVASEHTRLRKAGRRLSGLCPLHKEKTPSFSVDPDQGLFYCFGCGRGGDAIKLHMLLSGDDFPGAIEVLAQRYGIPLPRARREASGRGGKPERDIEGALKAAADFFSEQLKRSVPTQGYLEQRQIPAEVALQFGLGFAPDGWRHLLEALNNRFPMADLAAAGLVARSDRGGQPYDRFRNRLMFPIRSASGRIVGFGRPNAGRRPCQVCQHERDRPVSEGLPALWTGRRETRDPGGWRGRAGRRLLRCPGSRCLRAPHGCRDHGHRNHCGAGKVALQIRGRGCGRL